MAALGASEVITQPGGGQIQAVAIHAPAHAAATATELIAAFTFPFAGRLRGVTFTPRAAITGQDTDTTNLNVHNRGAAGSGTTELAAVDFVAGTNAAIAFPLVIATGLTTALADGVTLAIQAEKVNTGGSCAIPVATYTFLIDGGA
jgi:hypothetical protein